MAELTKRRRQEFPEFSRKSFDFSRISQIFQNFPGFSIFFLNFLKMSMFVSRIFWGAN